MRRVKLYFGLGGIMLVAVVTAPSGASAATPPITGSVSCTLTADSTFKPALGYSPGLTGKKVSANANTKWQLEGALTGCAGSQSGGSPRRPGPIATGDVLVKGKGVTHSCTAMTANGMTIKSMRIRWYDSAGTKLATTKATGSASVAGLFNGFPLVSFNPPVFHPGYVAPGVITFAVNATDKASSRAFPGDSVTMTAVADETLSTFQLPCSYTTPPLSGGVPTFGFHGANALSSLSIS